jgi:hypothetical protein
VKHRPRTNELSNDNKSDRDQISEFEGLVNEFTAAIHTCLARQ